MWHIFGDTHDITFWWGSSSQWSDPRPPRAPTPPVPRERRTESEEAVHNDPLPRRRPEERPHVRTEASIPRVIDDGLGKLIASMKPSFFPQGNEDALKFTLLSSAESIDPLMILRWGDGTLIFGTGFGSLDRAGETYKTLPDMRLPFSEKDRLVGWILFTPGFDGISFQQVLRLLGFPHVYATRDVIAYIRDTIQDTVFLDQCRFFEIFSPGMHERKIGDFTLQEEELWITVVASDAGISFSPSGKSLTSNVPICIIEGGKLILRTSEDVPVEMGEIILLSKKSVMKHSLRFTFDTFYHDKNSVGVVAGYTLSDREMLAANWVLTFVLEEDARSRAIVGHIFIDSRGFVHSQEMMMVHKEVLKGIRHTYEQTILANPRIERSELVQTLRREITKYCYLVTGRTPVVMPVIIER